MKTKRKYTKRVKVPVQLADPAVAPPVVVNVIPEVAKVLKDEKAFMRKPEKIAGSQGHVLRVDVFLLAASRGGFIPYDGDGYYADDTDFDHDASVWLVSKPDWAKNVVWFNK